MGAALLRIRRTAASRAMAAVVVDLAAFAAIAAHICATRLLARLSHGTARMRTATAHDAARTRAR